MRFFEAYRDHMTTSDLPYIIAIGASGGEGLQDMVDLLNVLPKPLAAIVMLVLHRPVDRISHLQAVLSRRSGLPVIVASEAERMEMGTCYIGEPDGHLTLMAKDEAGLGWLPAPATHCATEPSMLCSKPWQRLPERERSALSSQAPWTTVPKGLSRSTMLAVLRWSLTLATSRGGCSRTLSTMTVRSASSELR